MRTRKPWVRFRRRLFGWNVRFIAFLMSYAAGGPKGPGMESPPPRKALSLRDERGSVKRNPRGLRPRIPCLAGHACDNFARFGTADASIQPLVPGGLFHRC